MAELYMGVRNNSVSYGRYRIWTKTRGYSLTRVKKKIKRIRISDQTKLLKNGKGMHLSSEVSWPTFGSANTGLSQVGGLGGL